jgi:Ethanolamine ammonia-lyase, large subunit
MIKIINQEKIGQPRKGFVSFKIKITDNKLSKENIDDISTKLLGYESHMTHFKDGSAYEYKIDSKNKLINVTIHYPLKKWPVEEQRDLKLINDFAEDFIEFYRSKVDY